MPSSTSGTFSASYDLTTKLISAVACGGLALAVLAAHSVVIGFIAVPLILLAYAYSPRGYDVAGRAIRVRRLIGDVEIPLEGVREVRAADKDDFRGCVKLCGNGGLFGYYGLFRPRKLGKSRWYITDRSKAVVLITDARTAVFSPDDIAGFIETIRATVPVCEGPTRDPSSKTPGTRDNGRTATLVGAGIGIVAVTLVACALLYSPGAPGYTLTHDALTIHDRFYPVTLRADAVDTARIRVVNTAEEPEWRPAMRTNGFSNSHYHSGWFRSAKGQKMRMYRADSRRLVLLPPKGDGTPVLVEVKDPEKFIAAVRQEWSVGRLP